MNLVDWEEDYKRKDMIFMILIYQWLNIYQKNEKIIELWHSNHKLYHLGTAHYDSVMRNQRAFLAHMEILPCASQEAEKLCPHYSW